MADWPKTVAVIDIGTNSVRMVIGQVFDTGAVERLDRAERTIRLGHDTFVSGRLSQTTMNAAIGILRDYQRMLETYQVRQVRAVATSSVREAANVDAFLDRVAMALDLDVEVIDPAEESRLTVSAVRHAMGARLRDEDPALIVEVGGGSALLAMVHRGQIEASESNSKLGSIRLQEVLLTYREPPERAADLLRHYIGNVVAAIRRSMPVERATTLVAIGGDARFAARQTGTPAGDERLFAVPRRAFDDLVEDCARHAPEALARQYGVSFANAETLTPALLAYQALFHTVRTEEMLVSTVSMRDGLLEDLARLVRGEEDPEFAANVLSSAQAIGEKYRYDARHSEHVADLAVRLFDALQKEHRLTARERLLLRVAGTLHEIGGFVSDRAHHKHSYYLIAHAEIYGLPLDQVQLVAQIARYHRRSGPKASHAEFMALPREKRLVVMKLASLLRIADALDRGHARQVRDFRCERRGGELILFVRGAGDLTLERRALAEKGDLFEETFGLRVRLEEETSPPHASAARRAEPVP